MATNKNMRIIEEIAHPKCRISIFHMNQKYLIKVEAGQLEQTYKVSEMDVINLGELKSIIDEAFIENCMSHFQLMRESLKASMERNT